MGSEDFDLTLVTLQISEKCIDTIVTIPQIGMIESKPIAKCTHRHGIRPLLHSIILWNSLHTIRAMI